MLMQPRPMADTSKLLFPSFRFCMMSPLFLLRPSYLVTTRTESKARPSFGHSPFDALSVPEESTGGTVVRERGKPDGRSSCLVRRSCCSFAAHARPHPAGTHCIDLDRGWELFC